MGSDRDWEVMRETVRVLREGGVEVEVRVTSVHKDLEGTKKLVEELNQRVEAIVCGAGGAFHLAGVVAGITDLPVIAVPLALPPFEGWDALLASLQMPGGIPVAVMSVGKWGAINAGLLALRILGIKEEKVRDKVREMREGLRKSVQEKDGKVRERVREEV